MDFLKFQVGKNESPYCSILTTVGGFFCYLFFASYTPNPMMQMLSKAEMCAVYSVRSADT